MEVKIIRSNRRRRTVSARMVKDILVVSAPARLTDARLEQIIAGFKIKFQRRELKEELNRRQGLAQIAARLNEKYFENKLKISLIEYVSDQNSKFGCCNYQTASIRISHKVGLMPDWVRDYVLIHEMAHLIEPNHSKSFWELVYRYKLAERARGYLIAKGGETEEEEGNSLPLCGEG
jgi:predicted metal-dependent hydrolase